MVFCGDCNLILITMKVASIEWLTINRLVNGSLQLSECKTDLWLTISVINWLIKWVSQRLLSIHRLIHKTKNYD